MKFCGLQLHMVLVLAVICIILYVFYISKDIVHVEKEMRILRHDLDALNMKLKQVARHQTKPTFMTAQVVVPPLAFDGDDAADEVSIGSKIPIDVVNTMDVDDGMAIEDEVVSLASEVVEENKSSPSPPPKDDLDLDAIKSLSWAELKERCKQRNIPIKGCTKEQLIGKLAEADE